MDEELKKQLLGNKAPDDADYDSDDNRAEEKLRDIVFTVDDDIYEKCGVKKPSKGLELEPSDAEKLYRYQLAQDIEKINEVSGSFREKVDTFMKKREEDVIYSILSETKHLGSNGKYCEVGEVTREISWRNTSQLRGEIYRTHLMQAPTIAAKRYKEWLTGKPQGPSKEFLQDKAQRKADNELWEDIKYMRLEKTRVELREESKERSRQMALLRIQQAADMKKKNKRKGEASNEEDEARANEMLKTKKKNIEDNNFGANRSMLTQTQAADSMRNWDKGHKANWNYDTESFGKYVHLVTTNNGIRLSASTSAVVMEQLYEGPVYTAENFIKMNDEIAGEFNAYIVETNLKKAEYFISMQKAKAKKQAKIDRKQKERDEQLVRRKNQLDSGQMQIDAIMAKTVVRIQGGNFQKQVKNDGAEYSDDSGDDEEKEEDDDSVSFTTAQESLTADGSKKIVDISDKKVPTCVEATKANLKIALNPMRFKKNVRKVYKKVERTIRRKYARILFYSDPKNKKKLRKYIYGCECIFGPQKKVKPEIENVEEDSNKVGGDDDFQEIKALEVKKLREWEKYTEEELDKMDVYDRKRLKKMRKKDEEEDAIKEAEKNAAKMNAIVQKARQEKDAMKKRQGTYMQRFVGKIAQFFTGEVPEFNLSAQQKKKKEAAKEAAKLLKEEQNDEKAMESLFAFRERQRQAENLYKNIIKSFTGLDYSQENAEYNVDELIRVCRLGLYTDVIDIVDHHMNPIGPNATNSEGESAFYVVLMMVLNNESAESSSDLEQRSLWQKLKACIGNNIKAGKLDVVLKILAYKGGDVNFLKKDRDVDGTAILHEAAQAGTVSMIGWLAKRGARFDVRTSQLNRTPLMYAARSNQLNAVLYLLKKGAMTTINAFDVNGWTALHFAAAFAHPDIASTLMICGADIYARSAKGSQAVDEASTRSRQVMVETIRCFKQPDLLHRRLLNFFEIKYMDLEKEKVPDALDDDDDDDNDDGGSGDYGNGGLIDDAPAGVREVTSAGGGEEAPAETA